MAEQGDSHMEELVDQGLGMEEETHELLRRPSLLRETYHSDSLLLAPDTDFLTDDRSSAASGLDVADRLTYLEQRMQMQEDEIQLLKMALADVLKRLNISEEHQAAAAGKRMPGAKARPVSLALPSRAPMVSSSAASLKKSTTLPSASTGRNYSPSPTPSKSGMKSPVGSVKDGLCRSGKARPFSASTSAASTCRNTPDSSSSIKAKEPSVTLGTRRVIHCKVTMQIYLSPHARRTGSSEITHAMAGVPADGGSAGAAGGPRGAREGVRKLESRKMPPTITLNLQKATSGQATALIASNYKSPIMSPSQYFQICY